MINLQSNPRVVMLYTIMISRDQLVDRALVYYRFTTAVGGSIVGDVTVYTLSFV